MPVATAQMTSAPPRLAIIRVTRPSLRCKASWIAIVTSTEPASTIGSQVSELDAANTPTTMAPTSATTHTGITLRSDQAME